MYGFWLLLYWLVCVVSLLFLFAEPLDLIFLLCSEPMQAIYISGVLSEDIVLPVVTVEGGAYGFCSVM